MNSLTRPGQGFRGRLAGWAAPLIGLLAISSGACGQGGLSSSELYSPPPALAMVALVDADSPTALWDVAGRALQARRACMGP